ncbi:MAG: LytR family transcriptional regulator [Ruminococcaceae bacterium]|nr:LytR family transcriptional regulator [Oscillospiraceae bacterium]
MSSGMQFLLSLLLCLAAFSAIAFSAIGFIEDKFFMEDDISVIEHEEYDDKSIEKEEKTGKTVSALIIGKDISTNEVDALVLLKADCDSKKLLACSIPTETEFVLNSAIADYVAKMSFKDSVVNNSVKYLVNKVYAITGTDIDYYAMIDTASARKIFNEFSAEQGLEYTIPHSMVYDDIYEDINLREGKQNLSGNMAVQLMRYRGDGDAQRCENQVDVIKSFAKQFLKTDSKLKNKFLDSDFCKTLLSGIKETNVTASALVENCDILFSLSEYEFISVPFGGSTVIEAENVSALREDFSKPFN